MKVLILSNIEWSDNNAFGNTLSNLFSGIDDVDIDIRSEKLGYKLREAQLEKIPYMLVIGDKEAEEGTVSVRKRGHGDQGSMAAADFVELIKEEIATRVIW
jgi:threonyl-tRNA synthetase